MKKIGCAAIISLLLLQLNAEKCRAQNWNVNLLKSINPEHPSSGYWKMTSASGFILPGALLAGDLVYGIASGSATAKQNAGELFLSVSSNIIITEAMKRLVHEERPADKYPAEIFVNSPTHGKSFPSGHASLAFSTATTISLEYHVWYVTVPAYLWAGSVGYSRMYLGKHYPTDVLAGALLGTGTGYLNHWLTQQIFKPYRPKKAIAE